MKRPELDATIVASNIARQIEGKIAYRRAVKMAIASTMRMGAEGIKVQVSGRLNGAEMARSEMHKEGRTPLHTWITGRQIEAARIAVTRYMQRQGQIWIRIFPDKPITKKPAEVRMGKGKGSPEGFVAPVTPGRILIEVEGVPFDVAKEALRLAAQKLPVTTKFIVRRDYDANQNA